MTAHQKRVERTAHKIFRVAQRYTLTHYQYRGDSIIPWRRQGQKVKDCYRLLARWHLRMGGGAPGEARHKLDPHVCSACKYGPTADMYRHNACMYCWKARPQLSDNWRPKKGGAE